MKRGRIIVIAKMCTFRHRTGFIGEQDRKHDSVGIDTSYIHFGKLSHTFRGASHFSCSVVDKVF